ncbi:MAG TPA: type II CAAX endopeptidase family protein [Tepidisphaeraceae bacterium]|nr:type II CAAX endopeptidase family protein [Tepidisphaeraceae bacterium]
MASNSSWPDAAPGDSLHPEPVGPTAAPGLPWDGWDVLLIAVFGVGMIFLFAIAFTLGAEKLFYPRLSFLEVARIPVISVVAQLAAYIAVLAYMHSVATRSDAGFLPAVSWNWPQQPLIYLVAGVVISIGLQLFAHLLPMPKSLPIDQFFKTPLEAWVLSLFGITFAPLIEELFFRGFLYPVLARRLGEVVGIFLTALAFSLIHAPQLGKAWGPVLIIFLVGLALTIVRAATKSVAAGVLMHIAYNGTISVLLFLQTAGFKHLERMAQ